MKISKKICVVLASFFLTSGAFAFDVKQFTESIDKFNETAGKLDEGFGTFAKELGFAIPQAATQQNVWADAYIGKVFPSVPPHFGGGINVAAARLDMSGLKQVAAILDIDGIPEKTFFPVFAADIRVGGLFLPFDLDVAIMKTPDISVSAFGADLDINFFTIGADLRYAVLEGGLILPKVSVGAGYFYNQGSFKAGNKNAETSIDYNIQTMYLQAQVSKSFFIFTPFLGVRGVVSKCDNSYEWGLKGSFLSDVNTAISGNSALAGVKTSGSGSYKTDSFDFGEIQPQVYGGVGLNFLVLQTTLSISADLRHLKDSGLWSGAFSFRAKL